VPPPPGGGDYYYVKYPLQRAVADAQGAFAFDGLAPGRYRVWANLDKLTSRQGGKRGLAVNLPAAGAAPGPITLRLVTGLAITARVKDRATGKPIANATVRLVFSDFATDPTTGADGVAVLQPVTAAQWHAEVWAESYAIESRQLNLEGGSDAEAEFLLGPGGALEGCVRDPAGKPLAGAGLSARSAGAIEQTAYVETDRNGHYRLEHLPRDVPLGINLSRTDYGRKDVTPRVTAPITPLELTLPARPSGGSIAGTVHDQAGRPIAGAELVNMGDSTDDIRTARTGPDGRFTMHNLYKPEVGAEVVVRETGYAPKRRAFTPGPTGQPAEVAITLEPGHRLRGRVVDGQGRPLEGVWVYFAHGNRVFSEKGRGTTGADGRLAFDSLPAACEFSFHKLDYSTIENRVLALDTGAEATMVMIPAGAIAGRVVDARTGEPVRAFNVQLRHSYARQPDDPSGRLTSTLGDPGLACQASDGRFKVGNLTVGMPLQVTVSASGYERQAAARIVVGPSTGTAAPVFRLAPIDPAQLRTYAGRLVGARRMPVAGAELRLIAHDPRAVDPNGDNAFNWGLIESGQLAWFPCVSRFLSATTDDQGRFRFSGVR
jgi:hypothetical protein